tara:strand:+ start:1624 stop:3840 length:2217 start_codon:yes stop_codon:yes gene_type:complete
MFKSVKSIKNFGIFKDANTNAGQPFYQFNLFYGFNYSGKTTLSRVFRAMQLGEIPEGFSGASFEVDCHEASSIKSNNLQKVENLRVFNSDYIVKNVNFDESSVNPVLIVGERNIELETELQELEEAIPAKEVKRDQDIGFAASKEKEKNNRLTEVGRNVAVLSILGRSTFNASSARSMIASAEASHDLTPEKMSAYIDTARASNVSSVPKVKLVTPEMKGILGDIESIMATSVTQTTIAELDSDRSLRSWVEEGLERNTGHTTCQFCHNTISQARIDELNAYFSKAYKDLSQRIDVAIASVQSQAFISSIPDTSQLYPDLQKGFDELRSQIQPIDDSVKELKASLVKLLTDKKEHMAEVLPFNASDYPLPLVTDLVEQFNTPITAHNKRAANHSTEQRQAIEAIKRHYVYQETQNYDHPQAQLDIQAFKDASVTAQTEINANQARIDAIKAELNNTKQGAHSLNDNLRQYFGKTDIEIKPVGGTYKFMREDREAKHLSDGERTAIAFAYFITQLEDESLNGIKPIVYLDDPICSLDSNHIYNVLGIIKSKLGHEHVEQLFISTHNFEFFNLVKTWLFYFSRTKTGTAKRAQFFLVNRTGEQSKIEPLPKLLKDHRSEYAFLISKVKEAVERPENCDSIAVQSYVRKILEVYFSFRFNLTEFRGNGKDQIAPNLLKDIEGAEVKANTLYEYVNEKCHAKSMELGVQFPEAMQPQLTNVWEIITNAIEANDKPHYDAYYA